MDEDECEEQKCVFPKLKQISWSICEHWALYKHFSGKMREGTSAEKPLAIQYVHVLISCCACTRYVMINFLAIPHCL